MMILPADWCPISDPLPEGWTAPVTVLPVDCFKNVQLELNLKSS